ncbi:unnamed protein product [Cylicocyclus nassatus]|uniref:Trans-golgi network protein 2 n=1 Tax=Cylicocyclus nassatus TaxID=53992 RepID=A0AA36H4B4_CYLNA|nr:unnamed protein product [Cylicocyclus nassatus]
MDFRVRIIFIACACGYLHLASAVNSVEEIPPPLQVQKEGSSRTSRVDKKLPSLQATSPLTATNSTFSNKSEAATVVGKSTSQSKTSLELVKSTKPTVSTRKSTESDSAPKAAAPEFEDRNEQDEGGKGEEDPDAHVDEGANAAPPADDVAAGEGVAKEDTEPAKGKEKEENQLGAMVEDAKGNVLPPPPNKIATKIDFDQSEDSHFMVFFIIAGVVVFCLYLIHHNKKKILGLMFEGRSGRTRRNVRYRRLSQRDDAKEDVIY